MLDRMNKTVVDNDLLAEHEAEREQLRGQLEKILAFDKKWPKSIKLMTQSQISEYEIELDDLMTETRELLKCP